MPKKSFYICKIVENTFGYAGTTPFLVENNNNTYEIRYNISKKIKELLKEYVPDFSESYGPIEIHDIVRGNFVFISVTQVGLDDDTNYYTGVTDVFLAVVEISPVELVENEN